MALLCELVHGGLSLGIELLTLSRENVSGIGEGRCRSWCLTWSGEADPSREWRGGTEDAGCGRGGDVEEGGRAWLSSLHRRVPCASPLSGVL